MKKIILMVLILLILLFAARVSGIYQRSSIKAIEAVEVAEN